jgi:hypothetical protein
LRRLAVGRPALFAVSMSQQLVAVIAAAADADEGPLAGWIEGALQLVNPSRSACIGRGQGRTSNP